MSDEIIASDVVQPHEASVIAAIAHAVISADATYGVPGAGDGAIIAKVLVRLNLINSACAQG